MAEDGTTKSGPSVFSLHSAEQVSTSASGGSGNPFSSFSHAQFAPLVRQPHSVPLNFHGRLQRDTDPG